MVSTNIKVTVVKNGIFPSNTYVLTDIPSNKSIIIDPGLDIDALQKAETDLNLDPVAVLATHGHFDHIGNVVYFQNKYGIPFYIHEEDLKISRSANFYLKIAKLNYKIQTPIPDHLFTGKTIEVQIGDFQLKVYNFPGHTSGSCILQHGDLLFSGDTIYKSGLGFNHFPGEDKGKLKTSVNEIFSTFPDQAMIYPGHGSAATLEYIKTENKELSAFISNDK